MRRRWRRRRRRRREGAWPPGLQSGRQQRKNPETQRKKSLLHQSDLFGFRFVNQQPPHFDDEDLRLFVENLRDRVGEVQG